MGVTKRINTGNYVIDTFKNDGNPSGNVEIYTHTVNIDGNLIVSGTTAYIQAFDTINPIIHVNANLTPADSPVTGLSGIQDNRGSENPAGLYFDEDGSNAGEWIANNGANVGVLLTSYNVKVDKGNANPTGSATYVVVSADEAGVGASGLFVNAGATSSELVSIPGARRLAIIFGG